MAARKGGLRMLAAAPTPGHAEYPSSLPLALWWRPATVAIHNGRSWKTFYADYNAIAKLNASATIAVSPLDTSGECWYLAFDIDQGGLEAVRKLLSVLPLGCRPLLSKSGGRGGEGFHLWLFLDQPIETQTAVSFLKLILAKANIASGVEVFPASRNARPLKLPGSQHPETHVCEDFVNLITGEEYDTLAVWQALIDGLYRTPRDVITEYVRQNAKDVRQNAKGVQQRQAKARTPRQATAWLASQERLCDYLMQLAGRQPVRIGASFRCILPRHEEKHPSANFVRGEGGVIFYHDWHQRQGQEWYTLGEVFAALVSGQVKKLRPVENARWLALLGLQAGVLTSQAASRRKHLEELTFTFVKFLKEAFKLESIASNFDLSQGTFILPVVCKNLGTTDQSKGRRNQPSTHEVLLRVWRVVCFEALLSAQAGFGEVKLSARFLAKEAGLPLDAANRGLNLVAALGLISKTPGSGGRRGDRIVFNSPSFEEAWQRWLILGRPSLRQFQASLVAERLGPEVAAAIFRRAAGQEKALVEKETNPATKQRFGVKKKLILPPMNSRPRFSGGRAERLPKLF